MAGDDENGKIYPHPMYLHVDRLVQIIAKGDKGCHPSKPSCDIGGEPWLGGVGQDVSCQGG